jgi:LDH2 family malate/lactate/ureidoglycolate dehydrogenase
MDLFDALPAVEPMQAVFEPVMIPGHCEEQDDAERQRHGVAERSSIPFYAG